MVAPHEHRSETAPEKPGSPHRTDLLVSGMTCQNCVRHVGEALRTVPGVAAADVRLDEGAASVRWKADAAAHPERLLSAIQEAGYRATIQSQAPSASPWRKWSPLAGWHFNVFVGTAITIPLMILEWVVGAGMESWYKWLSFFLVLPLQIFGGMRFYVGAWHQLRQGQSNMDTLVSLGSTTAFVYSLWGLFAGWHQHLYFMDAAAIITLISVGHFLESKASAQAASSLKALLNLAPSTARLVRADGSEELVPVSDLELGDRIRLKPGDRIPTDGEVLEGASSVNESMLTGESMPVEKSAGSKVFSGTINESGQLIFKVTAQGDETALAHIIEIVQHAQASRASIQRLGDRVSSIFVPIVVCIALASALWWGLAYDSALAFQQWLGRFLWTWHVPADPLSAAIYNAAAVLIIACPCAMGLATPVAIMAGTNVAARRGILIRDGSALEKSGKITAVLFDKTGTLTQGKVSVAAHESFSGLPDEQFKTLAAGMAAPSNHPLSKATARLAPQPAALQDWEEIRGSGLEGKLAGSNETVRLGSLPWLRKAGVETSQGEHFLQHWTSQGATVIGLSRGENLLGAIALRDLPKDHAREVVAHLQRAGKKVFLVTGDNRRTAAAIAGQVGIDPANVFAEVRPEGKVAVVQELQARGEKIAFVGDGINDAPALEQADLGVALMNASDVARESADIVLLKADLEAIPEALGLSQATLRTIKQNLFWAFFYNSAGVPLAAAGLLSPIFSALAMGLSDLIVIGNALRLRLWSSGFRRG